MAGWEMKIIEAEARRLIALAAEDDDLRADLRALAREILAATEGPPIEEVPPPDAGAASLQQSVPPDPPPPEPLHELTLGGRRPTAVAIPPAGEARSVMEDDLPAIEARCRSKSEAARLAAARLRQTRGGIDPPAEDAPTDPRIIEWADRLADCLFWLEAADAGASPDISRLDDVGGCYEAVAEGLALAAACRGRSIERALPLLAEAQSMLRRALQRLQAPDDSDQIAAYEWAREEAARHRVYLKRHLRADDLADPAGWPDLVGRIATQAGRDPRPRRQRAREVAAPDLPTAEVAEVAGWLKGKCALLIGGVRRPEAQRALEAAFGLVELVWLETREHESIDVFEPYVARPEVALVLLAIRWSSHSFGDVKAFCDRHGKPMVRLPGGYGVNQVAAQILAQCSGQFGAG